MNLAPQLRRVLVVEDEPDIQTIARLALETVGGLEVTVCGSGEEALTVAPACSPDLILLDMMMPDMNGLATLEALRRIPQLRTTPVVFLTAKLQQHDAARFRAAGAIDIIPKPFDPMLLSDAIQDIWRLAHG